MIKKAIFLIYLSFVFSACTSMNKPINKLKNSENRVPSSEDSINFGLVTGRFDKVVKEDASLRTIKVRIKTCITNVLTGATISGHSFTLNIRRDNTLGIEQELSNIINLTSDNQGCLYWDDLITHKQVSEQEELLSQAVFPQYNLSDSSGVTQQLTVMANPTDTKWTTILDLRSISRDILLQLIRSQRSKN